MKGILGSAAASSGVWILVTVALVALVPSKSHAQSMPTAPPSVAAPQGPATAATTDDASLLFRKAIAAHDGGRLGEAEELFLKAWSLKKTWDIAANLGLVEGRLGKHAAAAQHLAYAARMVPPTERASTTSELVKQLNNLRKEVVSVRVRANVEGAVVRVNGELQGTTPLSEEVFVSAGAVTIEVTKDGHTTAVQTIEETKGSAREVSVTLMPSPAEAPGPRKEVIVAGLAVSGAAIVAGVVLAGLAASKAGSADSKGGWDRCYDGSRHSPDCPALDALRTDAVAFGNGAAWLFIGGAAVGGATLAYGLLAPKPASPNRSGFSVAPFATADGVGCLVHGRF